MLWLKWLKCWYLLWRKVWRRARSQKILPLVQFWIVLPNLMTGAARKSFLIICFCFFPWSLFRSELGILATGTIRADRLGKDVKINKKDLEDPEIGFIQTYFTKKGVVCVSWNDDGPVLNVSNVQGSRLLTTVKCSSPEVRDHRNIERPNRISFYNKTWEVETRWILLSAITTLASVAKSGVDQILSTQLMSSKVQHSE